MAAAGKVCTGFSKPYVATYAASDGSVTYTGPQQLARGVSVELELETGEGSSFFADNVEAETSPGTFTSGTVTLTVDGLFDTAEKLIMGLPNATQVQVGEEQVDVYDYGDDMQAPYMGLGFIVRYQSAGVVTYAPFLLTKVQFQTPGLEANTQEDEIEYQTQELTATILRDDTANHKWKRLAADQETEADAEKVLKVLLGGSVE